LLYTKLKADGFRTITHWQQQQQKRVFSCFKCHQEIKLKRKPDNTGWIRLNLDNVTAHQCDSSFNKKEQQQPSNNNDNLTKEVAAIKAQLLVLLVSRLD
jgi:hypothetical protein